MRAVALLVLLAAGEPGTATIEKARFAGRWYEHARMPSFFQKGCTDTTATYTLNEKGEFDVVNRCLKEGSESTVSGTMWVDDEREPGKLTLQLFWPIRPKLWVLERADDYSWAVLGSPDKQKAWVLARSPVLDEGLRTSLVAKLEARGYPVKQLERVTHTADAGTP
ncbi:MAG: lipocalin family protein [Myxococcaceae bacterium]|nr:lipocalin family protein [Myxococcaceae bacterium]